VFAEALATVTSELCKVSLPPPAMASLALTTRFMMTCFELAGIGPGVSGLSGEPRDQFDVFADQRPQQAFHVADDGC